MGVDCLAIAANGRSILTCFAGTNWEGRIGAQGQPHAQALERLPEAQTTGSRTFRIGTAPGRAILIPVPEVERLFEGDGDAPEPDQPEQKAP